MTIWSNAAQMTVGPNSGRSTRRTCSTLSLWSNDDLTIIWSNDDLTIIWSNDDLTIIWSNDDLTIILPAGVRVAPAGLHRPPGGPGGAPPFDHPRLTTPA